MVNGEFTVKTTLIKLMEKNFEDKLHDVYQQKPLYHLCGRRDENLTLFPGKFVGYSKYER